MNCVKWFNTTSLLIREEKWSEIQQPGYCSCWECLERQNHDGIIDVRIEKMFIKEGKFSKKAQQAALYMNMNRNLHWIEAIVLSPPLTMEILIDMVEVGLVDVNASSFYSLAGTFLVSEISYKRDALEYLFSKGCSVDIQDEDGRNLLRTANSWNGYDHQMTKFLIEHGADPFLEDKEGYSMVSYAKEYLSREDQENFFEIIDYEL